ncbi:MAG: transcriptional regulator NrdR [Planctomycetes bacterium]|nr:transcriptional regulator NrdR [Planctomycetota bacterium]
MRCPYCKKDNDKVIDTRPSEDGATIRRRRECIDCGKRFTTHERLEEMPVRVVKKTGRREPFDRAKVQIGLQRAVEKRSISMQTVESLVDAIEREVMDRPDREIPSREIGEMVMTKLRKLDEVAYVRFASVYREYQKLDEFINEIRTINPDDDESAADGSVGKA